MGGEPRGPPNAERSAARREDGRADAPALAAADVERAGLTGKGPVAVITDLCILRPHSVTRELQVASIHPGVSHEEIAAASGWTVQFAGGCTETEAPKQYELEVLRDLKARTAVAHSGQVDAA